MVPGRQILSSKVKISIFDSISSGTASITRSASRAASSTLPAYSRRPRADSAAPAQMFDHALSLLRLHKGDGSANAPQGGNNVVHVIDKADEFSSSCHECSCS